MDLQKRLISKQWKDRITAYEELGEILVKEATAAQPSDAVCRYAPFLKRMVADTANPRAQEAALSCLVAFLTALSTQRDASRACPAELRKEASDVSWALIEKCLGGRVTIKEKAVQALLLFIQIGALDPVMNQLLKGCMNKVAKVAATCLFCLKETVRQYGSPPIPTEPVLPVLKASFDHSVQEVRTEALQLTVEFHTWLGAAFDASIQELQLRPAQIKDLEAAYEAKLAKDSSPPVRTPEKKILIGSGRISTRLSTERRSSLLGSQDEEESSVEIENPTPWQGELATAEATEEQSSENGTPVEIIVAEQEQRHEELVGNREKNLSNIPSINLLAQLPADWYREASTGVWQKRKEQLDCLITLCGSPPQRLQTGDYSKVVKKLCEMLRDSTTTTVVAATAIKAMGALAKGLGRDFLPSAKKIVPILLDDFKTRKTIVGSVIHEVLDDMHNHCFTISDIMNEVGEGLAHKVPRVRTECLKWLKRCITNTQGATVKDPLSLSDMLLKCVDDSQAEVREAAFSVINLLSKIHGTAFTQDLPDGELDRARLSKLRDALKTNNGASPSPSPTAPSKAPSGGSGRPRSRTSLTGGTPLNLSTTDSVGPSPLAPTSPYSTPTRRNSKPPPVNSTPITPAPTSSAVPTRSVSSEGEPTLAGAAMEALGKARTNLNSIRSSLEQQLLTLEQQLVEAESRSAEDHHFASDMHVWNLELLAQQKADQQRIRELEDSLKALEKDQQNSASQGQYLPSKEEMKSMTREQLDELERRQEEYLLTIRKIKISLIR